MNGTIDLTPDQYRLVRQLIEQHLPNTDVWAYGSRVKWTSQPESDLDLVAFTSPEQSYQVGDLREAFEESDLPFGVEVLVWADLPESFRAGIDDNHTVMVADRGCSYRGAGHPLVPIGEIAEVVGGGTPSTQDPGNFLGDIPWITPKDLSGRRYKYVTGGSRNLTPKGLATSSARLVPKGTVLLSTRAPIGYVAIAAQPVSTNQGFRNLIPQQDHILSEYLYYWLLANVDTLKSYASGSTYAELSATALKSIMLPLPPLTDQQDLVAVLDNLDERIELNRRMNADLDAMVHLLYERWCHYGRLEPVGILATPLGHNATVVGTELPTQLNRPDA